MMLSERFIFTDMGRVGSNIVRNMLQMKMAGRLVWVNGSPHIPLSFDRELAGDDRPSFSVIRNPFDWYISYYIRDLEIHSWRGPFREWMFEREARKRPFMATRWEWYGGPDVDHVARFELLLDDLVRIFGEIMPDLVSEEEIRAWFPECAAWSYGCRYLEGVEQWFRDRMYDKDMIEYIYEVDATIFERFGYTFEERYYFRGAGAASVHPGVTVDDWESERGLSDAWALWQVPE